MSTLCWNVYILQVKINFRLKFFLTTVDSQFPCLLALIHEYLLGPEDKENWESTLDIKF